MTVPVWCAELARQFWEAAGDPSPPPRDLRPSVIHALPMSVFDLPRLSVEGVTAWFAQRGYPIQVAEQDRPLRACLVAWAGQGFVFLDANDDPAERRFSLAHELAHYLRDYWAPRMRVQTRLGARALDAVDGLRDFDEAERLHAVLRGIDVGAFTHLMARDADRQILDPRIVAAEHAADRLALELLAPRSLLGEDTLPDPVSLRDRLTDTFGLPAAVAARYADMLAPAPEPPAGFVGRLLAIPKD